jgi:hypothetical protein
MATSDTRAGREEIPMTDLTIDEEAQLFLELTAQELTGVREDECLYCYVARMLDEHGCDCTLRWASHYRDQRAPRATALEQRLGSMGGFCDCEIFLNAMTMAESLCTYDEETHERVTPREPSCRGVRRGSTKSCGVWERRRRWY